MYISGRLVLEGKDLRAEDVLDALAHEFETAVVDADWLQDRGNRLPVRPADASVFKGERPD